MIGSNTLNKQQLLKTGLNFTLVLDDVVLGESILVSEA